MREIKFEYLLLLKNKHDRVIEKVVYTLEQLEEIEMEVILEEKQAEIIARRQYTGLLDKNGKEIYEGDVVLGKFNIDNIEDYLWLSLTNEEKETQSKLFLIKDIICAHTEPIPEDIEVIGNIYENPELLTNN